MTIVHIVMSVRKMTTRTSATENSTRTSRLARSPRDRKEKARAVGYVSLGRVPDHANMAMRASINMITLLPLQLLPEMVDVNVLVGLQLTRRRALSRPLLPRALLHRAPRLPVLDGYRGGCWRRVRCLDFGHVLPPTVGGTLVPACEVVRTSPCEWEIVPYEPHRREWG